VAKATCPVLLVHGLQDTVVPVTDAHRIMQRGNALNVRLIECDGTHEAFNDTEGLILIILDFVQSALQARCETHALFANEQSGGFNLTTLRPSTAINH
jgi:alpha-beta hydrolase superfamily lysophospholipase